MKKSVQFRGLPSLIYFIHKTLKSIKILIIYISFSKIFQNSYFKNSYLKLFPLVTLPPLRIILDVRTELCC